MLTISYLLLYIVESFGGVFEGLGMLTIPYLSSNFS